MDNDASDRPKTYVFAAFAILLLGMLAFCAVHFQATAQQTAVDAIPATTPVPVQSAEAEQEPSAPKPPSAEQDPGTAVQGDAQTPSDTGAPDADTVILVDADEADEAREIISGVVAQGDTSAKLLGGDVHAVM